MSALAANPPRNWLVDDKTPFLLAILLGGLAWCVDHVADRAAELPIVQYKLIPLSDLPESAEKYQQCAQSKGLHAYAFEVRNISARHAFKNLSLFFYQQSKLPITEATWISRPPGLVEPSTLPCNPNPKSPGLGLTLKELQWTWNGVAVVWTQDTHPPLILYQSNDEPVNEETSKKESEPPSVLLVEANFTTLVIRNEFPIYYGLIVAFVTLIILFVVSYVRRP